MNKAGIAKRRTGIGRKNIVCLHQGTELYGSDRCFISSVRAIQSAYPEDHIDVIIPHLGPIAGPLRQIVGTLKVRPLWVLRRKNLLRLLTADLFKLPGALFSAISVLRRSHLVYINTVTIFEYMISARFFPRKAIIHIHEIPTGFAGLLLRFLVRTADVRLIFNSNATLRAFLPVRSRRLHVLYNGYEGPNTFVAPSADTSRPLRILMIGRLSFLKGQDILIEACGRLPQDLKRRVSVSIVGGTYGPNLELERTFHDLVVRWNCGEVVEFHPFVEDPRAWYQWCDLVVVPSRLPESLGRVPIEAMSFARGAIVSAIGGLAESVDDGRTGWHVAPDDPMALRDVVTQAIRRRELVAEFGLRAREKYERVFRQDVIDSKLLKIIEEHLLQGESAF